jgi:hypothetical protein
MDPSNLNILVEAKKEYLGQLYISLCPTIIEIFEEMYAESVKMSKGKKTLIQFQNLLREVPNWNDHMIHKHTETICNGCNWFNDLLAAVFVSTVKILSSVRLSSDGNKISLKIPNNKVFVHGCFIAASKDIYRNPYIFHNDSVEHERDMELTTRFSKCIEDTVKDMTPVQEILRSCMTQMNKDIIDIDNSPPEDGDDPEFNDEEEEEEEVAPIPEETGGEPVIVDHPPDDNENTRNIDFQKKNQEVKPTPSSEGEGEGNDDDVLFADAKEEPQKENIN